MVQQRNSHLLASQLGAHISCSRDKCPNFASFPEPNICNYNLVASQEGGGGGGVGKDRWGGEEKKEGSPPLIHPLSHPLIYTSILLRHSVVSLWPQQEAAEMKQRSTELAEMPVTLSTHKCQWSIRHFSDMLLKLLHALLRVWCALTLLLSSSRIGSDLFLHCGPQYNLRS